MRAASVALTVSAAGAAGLGWSLAEARAFTLRRFSLPVLPAGSRPLRVLHLSDLHAVPRQRSKLAWVSRLAELEPDLVVSTGDHLAHLEAVPAVLQAHQGLLSRPGVFVLGSNDYYAPTPKNPARYLGPLWGPPKPTGGPLPSGDLVRGFTEAGWLDLSNRRGKLDIAGHLLEFVGVDDPHLGRDRYQAVSGPADAAADLTIGVTHAPYRRVLDAMTADGAGLILAGHTHGGQLCLPGVGALVTNCDLPRRQARGVSHWSAPAADPDSRPARSWMHISAGLGTSPFAPVRFACRPEASLLTLTSSDAP